MRIRLDRTVCDGFGVCAKHAPGYFSLDDWGYASLEGDGEVPEGDRVAVIRALLDCPVHAITEWGEHRDAEPHERSVGADDAAENLKTEANEAEWGFTR
ncbi:MAG: ferredoxin [Mycobacterium sp.]|uniref:ferredoxin n=1 Tax=Mycobacterium sp. TaxID=1785 RepID=UPI003C7762A4